MLRPKIFSLLLAALACAALVAACNPDPDAEEAAGDSSFELRSTRIEQPLAETAFRAQLTPQNAPPEMAPGQQETLLVSIKNAGDKPWPAMGREDAKFAITLRNRWLEPDGEKVVNDLDGGSALPHDIRPGDEFTLPIKVAAPRQPGEYVLEFDMVQEQVNFFRERGSTPARVKVTVRGAGQPGAKPAPVASPAAGAAARPSPAAPAR
ncbi:MAG TPA: hypothetical protein VEY09_15000 [Pyrinomonadaceae bacterium]|nr:hypothetical protein [Pyrinomonadaceae bacterium]